ncbi:hypothetical protein [Streptomyces camponoticapitis]|uniref:hypothetical protein n=1 Tax=Streptomyces camponoticapitis TaxID=1616125 RepID=UPI0035716777
MTGAFVLAHTILYAYIAPILSDACRHAQVQWILLDFGSASIIGIWLTGALMDRHHRKLVILTIVLFTTAAAVLAIASSSPAVDYVAAAVWGLAFGGTVTLLQSALMEPAGKHADAAQPSISDHLEHGNRPRRPGRRPASAPTRLGGAGDREQCGSGPPSRRCCFAPRAPRRGQ